MPKKKDGTQITWKEFFKLWKDGINNITPIQKLQNDTRSIFISLIGFIISLIALIYFRKEMPNPWLTYGLILIFVGSVWSNLIKWLSLRTQVKMFKGIENQSLDINDILSNMEKLDENK